MSVRESVVDRWSEAVWWDYVIAFLLLSAHVAVVRSWGRGDWLSWIESEQRVSLYGTAAGVVSAIGGLSSIAISIYLSSNGERIQAVRRHYQNELRRNWKALLVATALICMGCLAAQGLDDKADSHSARFVFEASMAFAFVRFLRMLWLLDRMMGLNDLDQSAPPPRPAPRYDPGWRQRNRTP
ncbi:hypothetical protein [Streptomyces violaceorubidus]|uniref:hypothetical protein n=1 Tax=Streptomyces violaceorubidus TaxID=284042 RepID=UPI00056A6221|nr:hypothetical protein [Streptomyces violaceorubidus]